MLDAMAFTEQEKIFFMSSLNEQGFKIGQNMRALNLRGLP